MILDMPKVKSIGRRAGRADLDDVKRPRNLKVAGGVEGNRTPDLCSAIAALSHLSYDPGRGWYYGSGGGLSIWDRTVVWRAMRPPARHPTRGTEKACGQAAASLNPRNVLPVHSCPGSPRVGTR